MKFDAEVKLNKDAMNGGFSAGLSMLGSDTMSSMTLFEDTVEKKNYKNAEGLSLTVTYDKKGDTYEVNTVVKNAGKEPVTMEMLSSFVLREMKVDKIYRMLSFWSAEGKLKVESVTDLHLEKSWNGCAVRIEKFGNVGSMPVRKYFPFLAVEDSETGLFTGIQLYSASSWQMQLECKETELFTIAGGIADRDFGQWTKTLAPGEEYHAPKAVIATGDSLLDVCDKLVKAQNPAISDKDDHMSVMFNEYCTTWGNPTFENVKKIADKIKGKGIDFLVIDSGWYGNAVNWWDMVGDWRINEERFPGGLKPIADYIKSCGMMPGLWYEMESVTSGAKQYNDTDLLLKKDGYPLTVGNRRFWDMENPEAIEYLTKMLIERLKNDGFGYLKVDYNDTIGMGCDGPDSMGENLRNKVLASQAFFKKIRESIPGIVIENCSSGGHRLEPSMMELVSQASFSDAHEITSIPVIAANLHRVIKPSQSQIWAVMRKEDTKERQYYSLVSTLLGRMCLSGDIYDLSDAQWDVIDEAIAYYKKVSDIIKNGKTTCIDSHVESYNDPTGSQLVVRDLDNKRLVIFHRFKDSFSFDMYKEQVMEGGYSVEASFGEALTDFSAVSLFLKK